MATGHNFGLWNEYMREAVLERRGICPCGVEVIQRKYGAKFQNVLMYKDNSQIWAYCGRQPVCSLKNHSPLYVKKEREATHHQWKKVSERKTISGYIGKYECVCGWKKVTKAKSKSKLNSSVHCYFDPHGKRYTTMINLGNGQRMSFCPPCKTTSRPPA